MAKSISRKEAFNIAGTNSMNLQNNNEQKEIEKKPVSQRKTTTTPKRQANNTQTRSVTCYMPIELYKKAKIECIEKDCSMTNLVNWAVEAYIKNDK